MIGGDAGPPHGLGPGQPLPLIPGFAPADEHQSHVSKGRQIAGGSQGPLPGHHGRHVLVEHGDEALDQLPPDAGVASHQGIGPEEHHGPDDLPAEGRACGHAVAQDQVLLKLGALLVAHVHLGEFAEARGDAVYPAVLRHDPIHQGSGPIDGRIAAFAEPHRGVIASHRNHLFDGQALSIQNDRGKGTVRIHSQRYLRNDSFLYGS